MSQNLNRSEAVQPSSVEYTPPAQIKRETIVKLKSFIARRITYKIAKYVALQKWILERMVILPKDTFIYKRCNLTIKWLDIKIELLTIFLNELLNGIEAEL